MGDIIDITCKSCKDNNEFFVGMGMSGQLTNIYHCPKCNFIDIELDEGTEKLLSRLKDLENISKVEWDMSTKNIYCSECKSSNVVSVMNEIEQNDIEKHKCHKCNEKQLEMFSVGNWD